MIRRPRVYPSGAIRPILQWDDEDRIQRVREYRLRVVNILIGFGVDITHPGVATLEELPLEDGQTINDRDIAWVDLSDGVVLFLDTPSLGAGIEVGHAISYGTPVLGLAPESVGVSGMVEGKIDILRYPTMEDRITPTPEGWDAIEQKLREVVAALECAVDGTTVRRVYTTHYTHQVAIDDLVTDFEARDNAYPEMVIIYAAEDELSPSSTADIVRVVSQALGGYAVKILHHPVEHNEGRIDVLVISESHPDNLSHVLRTVKDWFSTECTMRVFLSCTLSVMDEEG